MDFEVKLFLSTALDCSKQIFYLSSHGFSLQYLSRVSSSDSVSSGYLLKQDGNLVCKVDLWERCCENSWLNIDYENWTNVKIKQHLHISVCTFNSSFEKTCLLLLWLNTRKIFFNCHFGFFFSRRESRCDFENKSCGKVLNDCITFVSWRTNLRVFQNSVRKSPINFTSESLNLRNLIRLSSELISFSNLTWFDCELFDSFKWFKSKLLCSNWQNNLSNHL